MNVCFISVARLSTNFVFFSLSIPFAATTASAAVTDSLSVFFSLFSQLFFFFSSFFSAVVLMYWIWFLVMTVCRRHRCRFLFSVWICLCVVFFYFFILLRVRLIFFVDEFSHWNMRLYMILKWQTDYCWLCFFLSFSSHFSSSNDVYFNLIFFCPFRSYFSWFFFDK